MIIDHNCLGPGLFPLASFFNHSCAHNCSGYLTTSREDGVSVDGEEHSENDDNIEEIEVFEVRTVENVPQGSQLVLNYLEEDVW